jgi:hypothetical protein
MKKHKCKHQKTKWCKQCKKEIKSKLIRCCPCGEFCSKKCQDKYHDKRWAR